MARLRKTGGDGFPVSRLEEEGKLLSEKPCPEAIRNRAFRVRCLPYIAGLPTYALFPVEAFKSR